LFTQQTINENGKYLSDQYVVVGRGMLMVSSAIKKKPLNKYFQVILIQI